MIFAAICVGTEETVLSLVHSVYLFCNSHASDLHQVNITLTQCSTSLSYIADTDFVSLSRQLVFDRGTTVVPVEITIIDDSFFEVVERFTVRLAEDPNNPTDEVMINPDTAIVFIHDGKWNLCALQLVTTCLWQALPTITSQYSLTAV